MPWIVRVKNDDGSVADVLALDWVVARATVDAYRSSQRQAWIVDAQGRVMNEEDPDGALCFD